MEPAVIRKAEQYGPYALSVQASVGHYCSPRVNGLRLDQYTAVEVAVIDEKGNLVKPSQIGIRGFNRYFDKCDSPVAGWMPQDAVTQLRRAMRRAAARKEQP